MTTLKIRREPLARRLRFRGERMYVELDDGRQISVPLAFYPTLKRATPKQRSRWELIGPGVGFDWEELDLQLSVRGIVSGDRERHVSAATKRKWRKQAREIAAKYAVSRSNNSSKNRDVK